VDDLGCDLVPEQTASVDLSSRVTLTLLTHGSEGLGKVATVRWLRAGRQRVAEVVAGHAVTRASEVERRHAVVLVGSDGEELFVLLLLGGTSEMRVQLVEVRARDTSKL
jgi:hypothetical protein